MREILFESEAVAVRATTPDTTELAEGLIISTELGGVLSTVMLVSSSVYSSPSTS